MRLVISGITGFLGGHVAAAARRAGHEVIGISRRGGQKLAARADTVILKDILDIAAGDLPDDVSAIIHFATGRWGTDSRNIEVTVEGTRRLFAIARTRSVPRFVHASSMNVYRRGASGAAGRRAGVVEANPEHRDNYSKSKILAEAALQKEVDAGGLAHTELIILRLGVVFGAGGYQQVLHRTARELPLGLAFGYGRRRQGVPILDLRDLNAGLLALLARDPQAGTTRTFDVLSSASSGNLPTKGEFLAAYSELSGQARRQIWLPRAAALAAAWSGDRLLNLRRRPGRRLRNTLALYDSDPNALPHHEFWRFVDCQPQGSARESIRSVITVDRGRPSSSTDLRTRLTATARAMSAVAEAEPAGTDADPTPLILVGAGAWVRELHVPILRALSSYRVEAVADLNLDRAQQVAEGFPGSQAVRSVAELDDDRVAQASAVIATPGFTHFSIALELLERRAALLIEQPVALSAPDCARLRSLASAARRPVTVFSTYRLRPNVLRLWRFLLGHDLGDLVKTVITYHANQITRAPARWMHAEKLHRVLPMELAIHYVDLACLIGGEVEAFEHVSAVDHGTRQSTVSLIAVGTMTWGAQLVLDLDLSGRSRRTQVSFQFERATCVLDFEPDGFRVLPSRANPVDDAASAAMRLLALASQRLRPKTGNIPKRALPHSYLYHQHLARLRSATGDGAFTLDSVTATMASLSQLCDRVYPKIETSS